MGHVFSSYERQFQPRSIEIFFLKRCLEVREEFFRGRMLRRKEASEFFAFVVEQDHGGITFNLELFRPRLIFLGQFFVGFRKIQLDQNEIFGCGINKFFFRENILAHGDAGRAPVGTGKLDQNRFFLFFRLCHGCIKIGGPAIEVGVAYTHKGKCGKDSGDYFFQQFHQLGSDLHEDFCSKNVRQFFVSVTFSGMPSTPLIIATRNQHKSAEIRQMVGNAFVVKDATDFPDWPEVAETGTTFLENATLKAEAISALVEGYVLSDDSGLEVDALNGAPGVWSSSYGGEEGNHPRNNARLLEEMKQVPADQRSARFLCTMVIARDGKALVHFVGSVEGRILDAPSGVEGFGYDPLFAPQGYDRSFAELGAEIKNSLSHRGRALAQVVAWLQQS